MLVTYVHQSELLDAFAEPRNDPPIHLNTAPNPNIIGFHNATFTWANNQPGTPTPGRRNFRFKVDGDLFFQRGAINMITGPTGAGKSSILMALLGEMVSKSLARMTRLLKTFCLQHFLAAGPDSWFNLPREGGVSFATQESFVLNETIKQNILFGAPFDEARYKKGLFMPFNQESLLITPLVLYQCALETDLKMFEAGDETEVGEKGLTLR